MKYINFCTGIYDLSDQAGRRQNIENIHNIIRRSLTYLCNFSILLFSFFASCKKLTSVDTPVTYLSSDNVYSNDGTAIAAVTGIYSTVSNNGPFANQIIGMSGFGALSADELTLYSGVADVQLMQYYTNALTNNLNNQDFWLNIYPTIYATNVAIEKLTSASNLTVAVRQQLLGEVKFNRALFYFYLVNLYGDVPLVLTSDYSKNAVLQRTSKTIVWRQIIQDLHESAGLLSENYLDATLLSSTTERVRPTKWASVSLLARAYLYTGNWAGADSAASVVINNANYRLTGLDTVFLKNSNEAIWQLQPVANNGFNTQDALVFILPASGPDAFQHFVYLNDSLVNSFELGDQRRASWVDSVIVGSETFYYPFKYKSATLNAPVTEYTMVLRLAEQYLIRAEARAMQLNLTAAIEDLNMIRDRAGLGAISNTLTQPQVLAAIFQERRVELFTEWGHRWLDLKRTATVDAVMGTGKACEAKGGVWKTESQLYPVPLSELKADPQLVQNPGY